MRAVLRATKGSATASLYKACITAFSRTYFFSISGKPRRCFWQAKNFFTASSRVWLSGCFKNRMFHIHRVRVAMSYTAGHKEPG